MPPSFGIFHHRLENDDANLNNESYVSIDNAQHDCTPPVFDPDNFHLHLWQTTKDVSKMRSAHQNNLRFLPRNTTINTLNDDDLTQKMKLLSGKLEQCAGITGAFDAYLDLRPMAFRVDLYRACQLWDTGGLYLDDKIWLTKDFSTFVNVREDTIVLPKDRPRDPITGEHAVWNAFMWSRPRHPIWEHIIRHIIGNVQSRFYDANPWEVLSVTGPIAYYNGLREYKNLHRGEREIPRRDLTFVHSGVEQCTQSLPRELHRRCSFSIVLDTDSGSELVAFNDEHDYHASQDPSLYYGQLYFNQQLYCDVPINHNADPCVISRGYHLQDEQLPPPPPVTTSSEQTGIDTKPNEHNLRDQTLAPLVLDPASNSDTQHDGDSVVEKQAVDCTPPLHDPEQYHLHLWQSTHDLSVVQHANENNLKFLPGGTTIHTLSDDDLTQNMKSLSVKLEECAGIAGAFQAFLDLRPMAYRADLYRAAQLWDTGGLWMDDKIWLTKDFSTFVNVHSDTILLPSDIKFWKSNHGGRLVHNGIMWSVPRHSFLKLTIERMIQNVQNRFYGRDMFAITGPRAYYRSLVDFSRRADASKGVRRDLELHADGSQPARKKSCAEMLPSAYRNHECYSYFALSSDPSTMVAFRDNHQHHLGTDEWLAYTPLWRVHKVYCDTWIWNAADPCLESRRIRSKQHKPVSD